MNQFVETDHDASFLNLRQKLIALGILANRPERLDTGDNSPADELAFGFDHWCLCVLSEYPGELTNRQRALLNALDAYFDEMCREGNEQLWAEEAIRNSDEWSDIRRLAGMALESFGW